MARASSKAIMGYLPIEERHYPALLSLVTPATPAVKLLDPFTGEGAFLEAAARSWSMTPYANELDGDRAASCVMRCRHRHPPKLAPTCSPSAAPNARKLRSAARRSRHRSSCGGKT